MPPRRWGRRCIMSPPELHKTELVRYIKKEIEDNNLLGLVGDELDSMANTLATCDSKQELFNWCQTLMLPEVVAAEVTKRRVDKGPPFKDTSAHPLTTTSSALGGNREKDAGEAASGNGGGGGGGSCNQLKISARKLVKKRGALLTKRGRRENEGVTLKPGFFECGCFASEHNLRGNCANCGRIICEQESAEKCYACGLDPSTCVAYEIKVQEGLLNAAAVEKNRKNYEAAVAKRDELLRYADTRAKRTTVIDDQAAVFLSPKHAWMSLAERKKAEEDEALAERRRKVAAMHRAKGAYTAHLDIMNQNVSLGCQKMHDRTRSSDASSQASWSCVSVDDENVTLALAEDEEKEEVTETRVLPLPSLMQKIWYSLSRDVSNSSTGAAAPTLTVTGGAEAKPVKKPTVRQVEELSCRVQQNYYEDDVSLFINALKENLQQPSSPVSVGSLCVSDNEAGMGTATATVKEEFIVLEKTPSAVAARFAPTPAMRMNDNGICLSMHQPWASLLVAGIKVHEGRTWDTDYRGRLWIHAASAQPHDIAEVEGRYAKFMTSAQKFPKHYPTRVLLGYVYLVDCMDLERYEQTFEEEEQQEKSPFLFICAEAKVLPFPLPMEGNHKLFKMDRKLHAAARKQLKEIM